MRARALFIIGVASLAGCASGGVEAPAHSSAGAGEEARIGEAARAPEPVPESASAPEAPQVAVVPSGPGQLHVEARVGREPHAGAVEVLDAEGAVVAEAHDGEVLTLPAGTYALRGRVTDPALLADLPQRTGSPVTLEPEGDATARLVFGRARIRIVVLREGEPTSNAQIAFRRHGHEEAVVEHLSHGDYLGISSGRWDLFVTDRGYTVRADDVPLQNGAAQTIPVTFQ